MENSTHRLRFFQPGRGLKHRLAKLWNLHLVNFAVKLSLGPSSSSHKRWVFWNVAGRGFNVLESIAVNAL